MREIKKKKRKKDERNKENKDDKSDENREQYSEQKTVKKVNFLIITLPNGPPQTVFREFIFISGRLMLLRKEFTMAEDSLHVTMWHITTY